MSRIKFKLDRKGVAELMKSGAMQGVLKGYANNAVARCGPGYVSDMYVGKNRANAMIKAETYQAKADNLRNNTILKSVR